MPPSDTHRVTALAESIYVVSTPAGIDQAFSRSDDAHRYARGLADARISEHVLRSSVDAAIVIIDRRVVVSDGAVRSDRTSRITQFVDDSLFTPVPADVEWFRADNGIDWHIVGFGTDEGELDARIGQTVDRLRGPVRTARADRSSCGEIPTRPA